MHTSTTNRNLSHADENSRIASRQPKQTEETRKENKFSNQKARNVYLNQPPCCVRRHDVQASRSFPEEVPCGNNPQRFSEALFLHFANAADLRKNKRERCDARQATTYLAAGSGHTLKHNHAWTV